ncbi:DEP domain-containing protein 1B-like [Haliotis cracherodii]|uniref:DEP domain-containing protein 1B-like n=1 Tax=Haliotis cracherodii TaxID=6455 RepID=UPI0039E90EAA
MDFSSKQETDVYIGPYRATKLWNEIIHTFRKNMPCGRHRRYMRTYDNCFVASGAVDWLLKHLRCNPNFGPEVTRCQTVQLLKKLFKSGVFEDVRTSKHGRSDFIDNGRLYRFIHKSPPRAPRPVLVPRANYVNGESKVGSKDDLAANLPEPILQECHLVGRVLAAEEIEDVWKSLTLHRLQQTLGTIDLGEILDSSYVNGRNIHHNCLYVNKSGIVTNIEAKDQLPHWAMSAMKCLARWPEKVDDNLPSYPGFEKDVFGVVKDYFCGLAEPLMTFEMYEVITNVFVQSENRLPRHSSPSNASNRSTPKSATWSYASLENLLIDIVRSTGIDTSPHQHRLGLHSSSTLNLSTFNPAAESTNIHIEKKYGSSPELKVTRYETAFGPENKTVTRVFYTNGVATDYGHCGYGLEESCMPLETHFDMEPETSSSSASNSSQVNFERAQSLERLNMEPLRTTSDRGTDYCYNYSANSSGFYETPPSQRDSFHSVKSHNSGNNSARSTRSARGYISRTSARNSSSVSSNHKPVLDGAKLQRNNRMFSASSPDLPGLANSAPRTMSRIPDKNTFELHGPNISMADLNSPEKNTSGSSSFRWRRSAFLNLGSEDTEERTRRALRLVCLLLPPANRRRLQLLLKLMYKMCNNQDLCLDRTQTTRQLLLDTFTRTILSSHEEADMDELLVRQIVSFLIDNYAEIMTAPLDLKVAVEERLKDMQKPQIVYSPGDPALSRYCTQVSVEQYETQKLSSSQKALADLLEEIIADQSMSIKDKKKRLKQFSKTYPSLYYRRFPTSESEAEVIPPKPKIKPPLLVKPLMKLRGLRL